MSPRALGQQCVGDSETDCVRCQYILYISVSWQNCHPLPWFYFSTHETIRTRNSTCPSSLGPVTSPGQTIGAGRQKAYFMDTLVCVVIIRMEEYERTISAEKRGEEQWILSTLAILSCCLLLPIWQKENFPYCVKPNTENSRYKFADCERLMHQCRKLVL